MNEKKGKTMIERSKPYEPEILAKLHKTQIEILEEFERICEKYNLEYFAIYGTAIGAVRHQGFIPWDDDIDVGMLREDYEKFLEIARKELGEKYQIMTPLDDPKYACTVTHLQKKNTKFVPIILRDEPYQMCIDLDIFPFDHVATDPREAKIQQFGATFLGRILFLIGTGEVIVPIQGWKGKMAEYICKCSHVLLKVFHVSPERVYKKFKKISTKYNKEKSSYVTSFEYAGGLKDKIKWEELFPTKEVKFENIKIKIPANNHEFLSNVYGDYMKIPPKEEQINHFPYMIQFEGEEPYINE
ncbi:LicD family protein [Oliverpabstia intestinalis]|uniref:LicD family protein n=2 Tax=Oliverpabstia intestinalis TaxID=2606633 RepID=UPI003F8B7FC2